MENNNKLAQKYMMNLALMNLDIMNVLVWRKLSIKKLFFLKRHRIRDKSIL